PPEPGDRGASPATRWRLDLGPQAGHRGRSGELCRAGDVGTPAARPAGPGGALQPAVQHLLIPLSRKSGRSRGRAMVERVIGDVAAGLGHALRWGRKVATPLPGLAAPVVVLYGVWQVYQPAAWILAGL